MFNVLLTGNQFGYFTIAPCAQDQMMLSCHSNHFLHQLVISLALPLLLPVSLKLIDILGTLPTFEFVEDEIRLKLGF